MLLLLTALKISQVPDPILSAFPGPKPDDGDRFKTECTESEEDELLYSMHIMNTPSDQL